MNQFMNEPLVSIIIPTYNRSWSINRAIDSCLTQTYQNFEIVITDDGSSDDTVTKIFEYKNDKIKYFKFKKNLGVIKARNNSIINSKGDWILLFDSDDELNPNCLEVFVKNINLIKEDRVKMIFAHFKNSMTSKTKISKQFQKKINQNNILKYHDFICNGFAIGDPLPIVKKEIFDKVPYDTHVKRNMAVVWHQFFKISDVLVIDEYLGTCYTEGNDRITANIGKDSLLWIDGLKEYINLFKKDILDSCPSKLSFHYKSLAIYQYQANEIKQSRQSFLKSITYNPLDYKSWIYLLASFNKNLFQKLLDR